MKYDFRKYETPLEIQKYNDAWNDYFEKHRNKYLEDKINNNQIDIDVYYDTELLKKCDLDFCYKYKKNNDLDECYGKNRKALRYLFENGYKWFYLSEESNLYKTCIEVGNHLIHSPFEKINNKIFILQNENKLYCILGAGYFPRNYTEIYFGYVGEMGRKTFKQANIFDYMEKIK